MSRCRRCMSSDMRRRRWVHKLPFLLGSIRIFTQPGSRFRATITSHWLTIGCTAIQNHQPLSFVLAISVF